MKAVVKKTFITLTLLLSSLLLTSIMSGKDINDKEIVIGKGRIELVNDTCVYDKGTHAAFTSLEEWNNELYLAFREGSAHRATETDKGKIRVLKKSGEGWILEHTFEVEGQDLRDPYFLKWHNQLYLYTIGHYSVLTKKGWTKLRKIKHNAPHYLWIWKIRSYKNKLYGVGYANNEWPILLTSDNGEDWKVVEIFKIGGCASEADMVFVKDKIYICLRIDKPLGSNSMWGCGEYPFTDIKWTMMLVSIASPELMYLSEQGMLLLSGREYQINRLNNKSTTDVSLLSVNFDGTVNGRLKMDTEKGWDKGYPSFCYHKGKLYMSYYLGNSTQSAVRLSTFNIKNNGK